MQPQYPGQMPGVRLNLINVVLALDLSTSRSVYFLASTVNNLIQRALPLRFGVAPLTDDSGSAESIHIAKVVSYLMDGYDLFQTINFLKQVCPIYTKTTAVLGLNTGPASLRSQDRG